MLIVGLIIGANFKYNQSKVTFTPFQISATETAAYGNYAAYNQTGVVIRGTILQPIVPKYSSGGLRPAVFFFHGLFARKEFHYHYAIELARAGFVVICPDHGGMGDSIGTFKLGWDIIPFVMTLIDYLPVLNATYNLKINGSWVGSTGHSYGGISTLFSGIYRPYNKTTGKGISACASIWTWSNFTETIEYMLSDFGDPAWDLLDLVNIQYILNEPYGFDNLLANIEARNAIDKVNGTTGNYLPPNWLLVTSWDDGLVLPEWQMEIMAAACYNNKNPSINTTTYYNYIKGNITYANNFTWRIPGGSFENGSMRQIFLPRDMYAFPQGHLTEGFLIPPLLMILNWFGDAFNWNVSSAITQIQAEAIDLQSSIPFWPDPIQGIIPQMYLGPILIIFGCVIIVLPLISYLARGKKSDDEYQKFQFQFPKGTPLSNKETLAFVAIIAGIYIVASLPSLIISQVLNIKSIIPYLVADGLVSSWLIRSILALIALVPLLWIWFNRYGQNFTDIGIKFDKKTLLQAIIVGVGVPLIFFGIWDLLNLFTTFPLLIPIASPTMGYFGLILLMAFIFISAVVDEIYLRGLIQTKIDAKIQENDWITHNKRVKKWIAYFLSVLLSLLVNIAAISFALAITVDPAAFQGNIAGTNFAAPLLLLGIAVSLIPSIINPYIYQRTKSIWACALFTMVFLGIFYTSRLGLGLTTF
ncbi:MAG: alpha/beta hydrolase family protein [Candidatus Helarchaeota archaeon]